MPALAEVSNKAKYEAQLAFRVGIDAIHQGVVYPLITSGRAKEDREIAHERSSQIIRWIQEHDVILSGMRWLFSHKDPTLITDFAGITVPNFLGVAAGFDKKAQAYRFLGEGQGFGHVTIGSFAQPFEGRPRPRLFHHEIDRGFTNRMGFPGRGYEEAEQILDSDKRKRDFALFVSAGTSSPSVKNGTIEEDLLRVGIRLARYANGIENDLSCPNVEGVKNLQEPDWVKKFTENARRYYDKFWYKLSPDLPDDKLADLAEVMLREGVSGIALTNTTIDSDIRKALRSPHREEGGGISGAPLTALALQKSRVVYEATKGKLPIKRAGGVRTTEDVWKAMVVGGADIVDVFTAYVEKETSTPNYSWYVLTEFAAAMKVLGIRDMEMFRREIKGRVDIPYPLAS